MSLMPKLCNEDWCSRPVFGGGYCSNHQYKRTDKKPKKPPEKRSIRKVSKKLSAELRIYAKLRKEFLSRSENRYCAVFPHLEATEVHHKKGRGIFLNDVSTWLAVSREGHMWVELHPEEAKQKGYSENRL